jgi:hypothetical protein
VSRHASRVRPLPLAVLPVALGVISAAPLARLVAGVARATARTPRQNPVLLAAVDLPPLAARADVENRLAPRAPRLAPRLALMPHAPTEDATIPCLASPFRRASTRRAHSSCPTRPRAQVATWALSFSVAVSATQRYSASTAIGQFAASSTGFRWPSTPWDPPPSDLRFLDVDFHEESGCGVLRDGSLTCWGSQSGTPELLSPPLGRFVQVSVASVLACAVREDGAVTCWGSDLRAEIKEGFAAAVAAGERFVQVQGGCALRTDGVFTCPGSGVPQRGPFVQIVGSGRSPAGAGYCGLSPDGGVECWRSGEGGPPPEPAAKYAEIGSQHCGIQTDGMVSCWGTYVDQSGMRVPQYEIPADLRGKVD